MARPSEFSSDAETAILDIIRDGGTLDKAAQAASVSARTILRWLEADEEFRRKYAQAREDQGDWFADKIADLATDSEKEPADITARVNALKWLAAKRKPKVYGDKIVAEHTGKDGKDLPAPTSPVTIFQLPDNGRG
ncbi:hypothetical protein [Bosea sp. UC22_33]|uniref:terminase small subunit-like protein n=1 Tax=Bosea sp. UC22_33 TaxID=3350165 RepID=UPI00366E02F6